MMMPPFWILVSTIIVLSHYLASVISKDPDYPTANLSTSWINNPFANNRSVTYTDNSTVTPILLNGNKGPVWALGFFCNGDCDAYMLATFIVNMNDTGLIVPDAKLLQIVWSANRNNPVQVNAALQLTADGDLVLRDADGKLAWSTNTAGKGVAGLNLTGRGNLLLFDDKDGVVWQSFDHPSDCLLPGQMLLSGKNLTATASSTDWNTNGSLFSLSMTDAGLIAYVLSDPPQVYYEKLLGSKKKNKEASYVKFQDELDLTSLAGALELYINGVEPDDPDIAIPIPGFAVAQFIKLGADGHLRVFEWDDDAWLWKEAADIFTNATTGYLDECDYPMVCGEHGICTNGQCSCPDGGRSSFRQIDGASPNLGCSEVVPLVCNAIDKHSFLEVDSAAYFTFVADINNTDVDSCKEACLRNCSCKAVIYRHGLNSSSGSCFLPSQIFSLMSDERDNASSVSIKVQIPPKGKSSLLWPILGSILGVVCVLFVVGAVVFVYRKKKSKYEDVEEDYLDHIQGMPTRFSYEELVTATENFKTQLGRGGFGSVFEGLLSDGTRVAVKCLDGVGQVRRSFLAEVETIGSIHHVNLVRLIGFCAEKSHRLLVYEYMCNGSLDRWIYCRSSNETTPLEWSQRRNIVLGIAKGLAYLHQDCRQTIIHFDIKPQNILLDENHNAKLADFGLSKLVDKEQSKVVTFMKGTPGYLAPEWLSGVISEKVDVYSFGVVVLQIVSGRKVFEEHRLEEERHLLSVFEQKANKGEWLDLCDKCCQDVESNVEEIERMMQISAWCLQHHEKRPIMSMVMKVLEGANDVPSDVDYNFLNPQNLGVRIQEVVAKDVTPLLPSLLSGPR